jgi:hypothetical protein
MPYSKVDTALCNKKGPLLNYGRYNRNRKKRGGFESNDSKWLSNGMGVIRI